MSPVTGNVAGSFAGGIEAADTPALNDSSSVSGNTAATDGGGWSHLERSDHQRLVVGFGDEHSRVVLLPDEHCPHEAAETIFHISKISSSWPRLSFCAAVVRVADEPGGSIEDTKRKTSPLEARLR